MSATVTRPLGVVRVDGEACNRARQQSGTGHMISSAARLVARDRTSSWLDRVHACTASLIKGEVAVRRVESSRRHVHILLRSRMLSIGRRLRPCRWSHSHRHLLAHLRVHLRIHLLSHRVPSLWHHLMSHFRRTSVELWMEISIFSQEPKSWWLNWRSDHWWCWVWDPEELTLVLVVPVEVRLMGLKDSSHMLIGRGHFMMRHRREWRV